MSTYETQPHEQVGAAESVANIQQPQTSASPDDAVQSQHSLGEDQHFASIIENSPQIKQLTKFKHIANAAERSAQLVQLKALADNHGSLGNEPANEASRVPQKAQKGLPDTLKSGLEHLSGVSLDEVKVHYNSHKPAQLKAHAYAQGTDIHLASGQEKHLAHEAWHVVQQKQGRVKPTTQLKGKINVNEDTGLEREADVMGAKAMRMGEGGNTHSLSTPASKGQISTASSSIQCKRSPMIWSTQTGFNRQGVEANQHAPVVQLMKIWTGSQHAELLENVHIPTSYVLVHDDILKEKVWIKSSDLASYPNKYRLVASAGDSEEKKFNFKRFPAKNCSFYFKCFHAKSGTFNFKCFNTKSGTFNFKPFFLSCCSSVCRFFRGKRQC